VSERASNQFLGKFLGIPRNSAHLTKRYVASAVYEAMNAQELDVDTLSDVAQETQRSLQLTGNMLNER
jgi:hypothetical protein